jgi:hypothetical protein
LRWSAIPAFLLILACAGCFGDKTPDQHGFYAIDGERFVDLHPEGGAGETPLPPDVKFVRYARQVSELAEAPTLMPLTYLRSFYLLDGSNRVLKRESRNQWQPGTGSAPVAFEVQPSAGTAGMVYLVPSRPLAAGGYQFVFAQTPGARASVTRTFVVGGSTTAAPSSPDPRCRDEHTVTLALGIPFSTTLEPCAKGDLIDLTVQLETTVRKNGLGFGRGQEAFGKSLLRRFVLAGGDVNVVIDGSPLIVYAVYNDYADVVAEMIAQGAVLNTPANVTNPLSEACAANLGAMARILIEKGARLDQRDYRGSCLQGLLRGAEDNGTQVDRDLVALLIAKGMDVNARDSEGRTALQAAKQAKADDIVLLLKARGARG